MKNVNKSRLVSNLRLVSHTFVHCQDLKATPPVRSVAANYAEDII